MKNQLQKLAGLFPHADKALHFILGALIAVIILLITNEPYFGFAGAFLVGLGKEYSDHLKKGNGGIQTWLDWFATMSGGLLIEFIW
jgi:hypothetical protein